MSKKLLTIWFDSHGNMLEYVSPHIVKYNNSSYNYKSEIGEDFNDNFVFDGIVDYKTAKIVFKSKATGRKYCMFLSDFSDLMKLNKLQNNEILGKFRFVKKGQSQGFKFILTSQEQDSLKLMNV